MKVEPSNEFLLVMPDGEAKGFNDLETAKAYINIYYERSIDKEVDDDEDYTDITDIGGDNPRRARCIAMGVTEGRCEVYRLSDFIKKIEEQLVFESEKEEIIEKLSQEHINLNVYSYNLDVILADTDVVEMMEPYGDPDV